MWHGDGPLVPPSDLEFLYSPSAATCGSYVHTLQKTKTLSESTVIKWRIPKGRTQAISYTKKKKPGSGKLGITNRVAYGEK